MRKSVIQSLRHVLGEMRDIVVQANRMRHEMRRRHPHAGEE